MEIARDVGLARFFCKVARAAREGTPPRGYLEHADVVLGEDIERYLVGLPRVSETGTVEGGRARGMETRTSDRRRLRKWSSLKSVQRNDIRRRLPSALARGVRGSWSRREPDARKRARHHLDGHLAGCAGRDARVLRVEGCGDASS